jgi:hypothetical protein
MAIPREAFAQTTHVEHDAVNEAVYLSFGRALGRMEFGTAILRYPGRCPQAGAQRTDPKSGGATGYPLGTDINGNTVYVRGPQGDVVRIDNFVRLVRDATP